MITPEEVTKIIEAQGYEIKIYRGSGWECQISGSRYDSDAHIYHHTYGARTPEKALAGALVQLLDRMISDVNTDGAFIKGEFSSAAHFTVRLIASIFASWYVQNFEWDKLDPFTRPPDQMWDEEKRDWVELSNASEE